MTLLYKGTKVEVRFHPCIKSSRFFSCLVFLHTIPQSISLILILCFENARVLEYFRVLLHSKLCLSGSLSQTVSGSDFGSVSNYNVPLFLFFPGALFPVFLLIHTILYLGLEGSMNPSLRKEITGSPANPLHLPIYSSSRSVHHILTLSCYSFFSLSFLHYFYYTQYLFFLGVTLCRLFCLLYCALSLALTLSQSLMYSFFHLLLCPSQAIYQEWHPFPFQPSSFQHHFQHKDPKGGKIRQRK